MAGFVDARDARYPYPVVRDGYEFRSPQHHANWKNGLISLREATTPFGLRPVKWRKRDIGDRRFRKGTEGRRG